jgi:hypothetical protein
VWHHRTPSVCGRCRRFAPPCADWMTRFFAAKASSAAGLVATGFRLVANSLRLSAGGACPSRAASDALCRSAMRLRGFHLSMPRAALPREYRTCRVSQSRSTARRLRLTISRLRTPLIGSIPTEAGMSVGHELICLRPHSASTLAARSSFPPVTVMGRRTVLVCRVPLLTSGLPKGAWTHATQGASHQSLQPTCCQRAPLGSTQSRATGSHQPDRPFDRCPLPSTPVLGSEQ